MKRLSGFLLGVAAAGMLFGCGDNSKQCGSNTTDEDGVCVGTGSGTAPTCTGGTILSDDSTTCIIDPAACQDGTVLMDGACVDEGTLTADVTEAAEPNALGVGGEASNEPAGQFELKAIGGDAVVISGNLTARADADEDGVKESDYDTYVFQATEPTVLEISVDGVNGIQGGFVMLAASDGLTGYRRFGVNLTGDTAHRQLFLPKAGVYALAIADTRSLTGGGGVGDASSRYYVSIKNLGIPTPTAVALTAGTGTVTGTVMDGEVVVYTAPLGTGFNTVTFQSYDNDFDATIVAAGGGIVHGIVDEAHTSAAGPVATLTFGGVTTSETPIIVVDHVINTSSAAVDYRMTVTSRTATALKTDGTTATAALVATAPTLVGDFTYFYFDATANQTIGMNLAFNTPVKAAIVDSAGATAATLTGLAATSPTFTAYKGLVRFPTTGRYYLRLLKPGGAVGDNIIATSKIAGVIPTALTFGTPVVAATPSADFGTRAFTYALNASFWQQFSVTPNVASGGAYVRIFDSRDAYGRLDDLVSSAGLRDADPTSTLEMVGAPAATEVQGFIPAGFGPNYFITIATDTGAGAVDFGVAARAFTDLGNHAAPYTATAMATEALTAGVKRYYLRTTPGATVTIGADPLATLRLGIESLDYDESVLADDDGGALDIASELVVKANADGYVAFQVVDTGAVAGTGTYTLTLAVTPVPAPYYAAAAGTTTWTNICNHPGAADITPANRDDGMTAPVSIPAGFTLYGAAVTSGIVGANGLLTFTTFGAGTTSPYFFGQHIPSAGLPAQTIAPYFGDIGSARICTETIGGKLYVQWRGEDLYDAGSIIAVQAILDPATDSIEYVYAPYHSSVVGVAGVQQSDTVGQELFWVDEDVVHAGTSIKLTHL